MKYAHKCEFKGLAKHVHGKCCRTGVRLLVIVVNKIFVFLSGRHGVDTLFWKIRGRHEPQATRSFWKKGGRDSIPQWVKLESLSEIARGGTAGHIAGCSI